MSYERKTYDIHISEELRNILKEIETESLVAELLLNKRLDKEVLVDDPVNFISISRDDRTKISYLTTDRMSQIDISEYWTSSRRFQAKPGGFISKIFKNISSKEVEKFANLFRSVVTKPLFDLKVVKGEAIRGYYHYESYASDRGTLGASCMKHDSCQKYLGLYTENSDVISMLVMTNPYGELMGRALLWNFSSYKIMDRIYTICDEDLSFYFKRWATQNGYLYKSEQNWFNTLFFEQIGQKRQELKLEVNLRTFDFRYYPYMDTFKFFNPNTGTLTNYMTDGYFETLCSSEGTVQDKDYLRFDAVDKVLRYKQDAVYVNYLKIWTSNQNTHWSDINDCYILCRDSDYDYQLEDYIFSSEFDNFNNKEAIEKRKKSINSIDNIDEIREIAKKLRVRLDDETIEALQRRISRSQDTQEEPQF